MLELEIEDSADVEIQQETKESSEHTEKKGFQLLKLIKKIWQK